jgi:hypothetical protein
VTSVMKKPFVSFSLKSLKHLTYINRFWALRVWTACNFLVSFLVLYLSDKWGGGPLGLHFQVFWKIRFVLGIWDDWIVRELLRSQILSEDTGNALTSREVNGVERIPHTSERWWGNMGWDAWICKADPPC